MRGWVWDVHVERRLAGRGAGSFQPLASCSVQHTPLMNRLCPQDLPPPNRLWVGSMPRRSWLNSPYSHLPPKHHEKSERLPPGILSRQPAVHPSVNTLLWLCHQLPGPWDQGGLRKQVPPLPIRLSGGKKDKSKCPKVATATQFRAQGHGTVLLNDVFPKACQPRTSKYHL